MIDTEKLLASYDCGTTGGWLSDDLECGIDGEPWCALHMHKADMKAVRAALDRTRASLRKLEEALGGPK